MRERWLSKRALPLHVAVLVFVPGCAAAAWWQITRAQDGNGLSYLYAVEWPIFAILGVYFWWMLLHTDYDAVGLRGMRNRQQAAVTAGPPESARHPDPAAPPVPATPATPTPRATWGAGALAPVAATDWAGPPERDDVGDPELAAYNARLARLAHQGPKTWRRPEAPIARRAP